NRVQLRGGEIVIVRGHEAPSPWASLERWLRGEARRAVARDLASVIVTLGVTPGRIYIMDQRTKWGGCSALGNLSFSWRLIMAPEFVLSYIVTHEAVHLA